MGARISPVLTAEHIAANRSYIDAGVDPSLFWCYGREGWRGQWIEGYWDGRHDAHRVILADVLRRFAPVSSVLEVGCHCGPNLHLLGSRFPGVALHGVDCIDEAIDAGRSYLAEAGMNAELRCGFLPTALLDYADASIEWVLSCYALAYVPPDRLRTTLREMWRIASKGLVIYEPQVFAMDEARRIEDPGVGPYIEHRHCYVGAMALDLATFGDATVTVFEPTSQTNLNALVLVSHDGVA